MNLGYSENQLQHTGDEVEGRGDEGAVDTEPDVPGKHDHLTIINIKKRESNRSSICSY